jgi:hypothetical protein
MLDRNFSGCFDVSISQEISATFLLYCLLFPVFRRDVHKQNSLGDGVPNGL